MVSGLTRNQVPGNRLRVRIPCPPLRGRVFDRVTSDVRSVWLLTIARAGCKHRRNCAALIGLKVQRSGVIGS